VSLDAVTSKAPLVVAVEMGFGHLRAADAVAQALGVPLLHADREPLADPDERAIWARTRRSYERTSRLSQLPVVGLPLKAALDLVTHIPHLHPQRDLRAPTLATRFVEGLVARGLGRRLAEILKRDEVPLFTTYFASALAAHHHGAPDVHCLVTDSDLARAWVARDAAHAGGRGIRYLAPSQRAVRRLVAYGVPQERITLTGFPLPEELVGGSDLPILKRNLARRLRRLDRGGVFRRHEGDDASRALEASLEPDDASPLLVFTVGGAGAQAHLARLFMPSLRPLIEARRLRVALHAGTRPAVARLFEELIARHDLAGDPNVRVVVARDLGTYFRSFNALCAEADILWTKPSELTFFAALGLPLILAPAVGAQETYNRRWAIESGAGLAQRDPRAAGDWISEWLEEGTLAATAWNGFRRLPKRGLPRILQALGAAAAGPAEERSLAAPSTGSIATRSSGS
jgi:hypothetical protein